MVDEIEVWLDIHGKRLRAGPASLRTMLAQALDHIEAMLEAKGDSPFLAAFVSLFELQRAMALHGGANPSVIEIRCPSAL
ncbi:hypothetical protein [Methylobacterium sp. A54F]